MRQKINFEQIEEGVNGYLDAAFADGKIDQQSYNMAKKNTIANLRHWLTDKNFHRLSKNMRKGVLQAVEEGRWEAIVNTYRKK